MIDRTFIIKAALAVAFTAMLGGCQTADDGYPKIGHIKQPRADFLTPAQQQAHRRRLETAKAVNQARARRTAR